MGLFDYVRCDYKQAGIPAGTLLQTKCTEAPAMDTYVINENGKLFHQDYDLDEVADDRTAKIPAFSTRFVRTNTGISPVDYSGSMNLSDGRDRYCALFHSGELVTIEKVG
jgi:hypothetical protein